MQLPVVEILYQALASEHGIVVTTDNVRLLKQRLYAARKKDEDLACITLATSPTNPNGEIWLVKKETT